MAYTIFWNMSWWCHPIETFAALLALCEGIHLSPVDSPHKGQWCAVLMFSLICAWTNGWANNRDTGDTRRHYAHYEVTVMLLSDSTLLCFQFVAASPLSQAPPSVTTDAPASRPRWILQLPWEEGSRKYSYKCDMERMERFNLLLPSDAIWWHRSWSTLAQVMACCQ